MRCWLLTRKDGLDDLMRSDRTIRVKKFRVNHMGRNDPLALGKRVITRRVFLWLRRCLFRLAERSAESVHDHSLMPHELRLDWQTQQRASQ